MYSTTPFLHILNIAWWPRWPYHINFLKLHLAFSLNSLRPRRNRRHFADDIFKCILLNENVLFSIEISLKFIPKGLIKNIPALVQIMAWRRPGDKPLSEPMMVSLTTHICVNRPQWVWYAYVLITPQEIQFLVIIASLTKQVTQILWLFNGKPCAKCIQSNTAADILGTSMISNTLRLRSYQHLTSEEMAPKYNMIWI